MAHTITPQELGSRLAAIRKQKGLVQDEVARNLGIPRPSVAQFEAGKRNLTALELLRLSELLGFSMDNLLARQYEVAEAAVAYDKPIKTTERPLRPAFRVEVFENGLLYLLEATAGRPGVGEAMLANMLYFCDFDYYERFEEHFTGAAYRKLPGGPVPVPLDAALSRLIDDGAVKRFKATYQGLPITRYFPLKEANLCAFNAAAKEAMDQVVARMGHWNAAMITDFSLNDTPCRTTGEGDEIDYELVFYRIPPYSVRVYEDDPV